MYTHTQTHIYLCILERERERERELNKLRRIDAYKRAKTNEEPNQEIWHR